jgi:hypothetical protein
VPAQPSTFIVEVMLTDGLQPVSFAGEPFMPDPHNFWRGRLVFPSLAAAVAAAPFTVLVLDQQGVMHSYEVWPGTSCGSFCSEVECYWGSVALEESYSLYLFKDRLGADCWGCVGELSEAFACL